MAINCIPPSKTTKEVIVAQPGGRGTTIPSKLRIPITTTYTPYPIDASAAADPTANDHRNGVMENAKMPSMSRVKDERTVYFERPV